MNAFIIVHEETIMMTINVTFNDEEEEKIQALKDASGLGWHDFILVSVGAVKKKDLKKSKKQ